MQEAEIYSVFIGIARKAAIKSSEGRTVVIYLSARPDSAISLTGGSVYDMLK